MNDIPTLVPEPADTELAASALRKLDAVLVTEGPVRLYLAGYAAEVEVPRLALAVLVRVLDRIATAFTIAWGDGSGPSEVLKRFSADAPGTAALASGNRGL